MKPLLMSAVVTLGVGFLATAADPPAKDGTRSVVGKVGTIMPAANRFTLEPRSGPAMTFAVDRESQLRVDDRPARLDQFQPGRQVRVVYAPREGANRVVLMDTTSVTADDLKREVTDALRAAKDYTYQNKDEYRRRLDRLADQMEDRIADLQAQARQATGETKQQLDQAIQDLRGREKVLRKQMDRVSAASADAWGDIKAGVGSALEDLHGAYQKALSRFR